MMRVWIFRLLYFVGAHHLLRKMKSRTTPTVLAFHRVCDDDHDFWLSMPTEDFERLVRYCRKYYDIVPLADLTVQPIRKPRMALTFDDGYADFHSTVAPVLQKHGLSATVNVVTESIEHGLPLWTRQLADLFSAWKERNTTTWSHDAGTVKLSGNWLRDFNAQLHAMLLWPVEKRNAFFDEASEELQGRPSPDFLTWNQLRELHSQGFEVGSHSATHAILPALSAAEAKRELEDSKSMLDTQLNQHTTVFAFPNGAHTPELLQAARQCGYETLLLTDRERTDNNGSLPRITLYAESWEECIFRIEQLHTRLKSG